jgi:hypothetical protein
MNNICCDFIAWSIHPIRMSIIRAYFLCILSKPLIVEVGLRYIFLFCSLGNMILLLCILFLSGSES